MPEIVYSPLYVSLPTKDMKYTWNWWELIFSILFFFGQLLKLVFAGSIMVLAYFFFSSENKNICIRRRAICNFYNTLIYVFLRQKMTRNWLSDHFSSLSQSDWQSRESEMAIKKNHQLDSRRFRPPLNLISPKQIGKLALGGTQTNLLPSLKEDQTSA